MTSAYTDAMDLPPGESAFRRKHAVECEFRLEARLREPFLDLAWHVASTGELVRAAGVVEEPATTTQYACELLVEGLRIEFACDAEARRIVQQRVDRGVRDALDRVGYIRVRQVEAATTGVRIR